MPKSTSFSPRPMSPKSCGGGRTFSAAAAPSLLNLVKAAGGILVISIYPFDSHRRRCNLYDCFAPSKRSRGRHPSSRWMVRDGDKGGVQEIGKSKRHRFSDLRGKKVLERREAFQWGNGSRCILWLDIRLKGGARILRLGL